MKKLKLNIDIGFILCAICFIIICCIILNDANYGSKVKKESRGTYQYHNNTLLKDYIKDKTQKCGDGYAIGWWIFDENYLTYRNEELFGFKVKKYHDNLPISDSMSFDIKRNSGNRFYTQPQQTTQQSFDLFKQNLSFNKNFPTIFSCRNVNKCKETDQPIFSEMLLSSINGYKNQDLKNKTINYLRTQIKRTNHPILNISYILLPDKIEGIYHFFHLSDLSITNNKCEIMDGSASIVLTELARGLN